MTTSSSRRRRSLGVLILALGAGWSAAGVLAVRTRLQANAMENAIEPPGPEVKVAAAFLPQGWRFFTRNAQEEVVAPYRREGDRWVSASTLPNTRPSNLYGLDRRGRAQIDEAAQLVGRWRTDQWVDCGGDPLACLEAAPVVGSVQNRAVDPTLCGEIAFVSQKPVPWAWARAGESPVMPARVLRVRVRC